MGATVTAAEGITAGAVQRAFDAPRLTIGELAERLGVPRATLAGYIAGKRRTPAPVARRLAAVLRQHAEELAEVATTLEEAELEEGMEGTLS